jgi:hypothetical protein
MLPRKTHYAQYAAFWCALSKLKESQEKRTTTSDSIPFTVMMLPGINSKTQMGCDSAQIETQRTQKTVE